VIPGVDTHAGYGRINWKLVAQSGVRFMWNKSAEGNEPNKDDLSFIRNCSEAQAHSISAGVYFFPYPLPSAPGAPPGRHPLEQAERFHKRVRGLGSKFGELSPVVDAEWPAPQDWLKWGCSAPQINDWLMQHCHAVALLFGRLPVIYTYPHWWRMLSLSADTSWAGRYPLWLADYSWPQEGSPPFGWTPPRLTWVSEAWSRWHVCQHSAEGSSVRVPGISACPVDRNVMRSEDVLQRLRGCEDDALADTQPNPVPHREEREQVYVNPDLSFEVQNPTGPKKA
jgi:lysozyme